MSTKYFTVQYVQYFLCSCVTLISNVYRQIFLTNTNSYEEPVFYKTFQDRHIDHYGDRSAKQKIHWTKQNRKEGITLKIMNSYILCRKYVITCMYVI